jgi:hypothetical protein
VVYGRNAHLEPVGENLRISVRNPHAYDQ